MPLISWLGFMSSRGEVPGFRALNWIWTRFPEPVIPVVVSRAVNFTTSPLLLSIIGLGEIVVCPANMLSGGMVTWVQFMVVGLYFRAICHVLRLVTFSIFIVIVIVSVGKACVCWGSM